MANAFKNIVTIPSGTSDTIIYTCPTATQAIVKVINVYNSHSGSVVVLRKMSIYMRKKYKKNSYFKDIHKLNLLY